MTRLPEITSKHVVRALHRVGFVDDHQKGSHLILRHANGRRVTVPMHPRPLKGYLLRLILKQAGLSEEEFRELA